MHVCKMDDLVDAGSYELYKTVLVVMNQDAVVIGIVATRPAQWRGAVWVVDVS